MTQRVEQHQRASPACVAEDAEHASAENMHIEAAENIEVDADSLAANRAASRILLEETVSILLIFFFKF